MTRRPFLARAALGALLFAGCASAPPAPDRIELPAPPLLAVAAPATDRVFVVLRDASLVVVDAAAMQANIVAGSAPMAPTCAAVDAAGWLAVGGNDGTALLLDADTPNWERAIPLAARKRPLTAIGVLAAAPAATAAPAPVAAHALLAGFPADLQAARVLGAPFAAADAAAAVQLRAARAAAPAHVRAIAVDPVARRWFVLADGAIASVPADAAAAEAGADGPADRGERPAPPADFALAAPAAHALAWSGSQLVVASDDGVRCHDAPTGAATALPATDGARMACVVASDALGAVAALDERGALWLWRRDGDGWQRAPTPADLPPARALAFAEPSRRLLVVCGPAAEAPGCVRRIDLPNLPRPQPAR